MKYIIFVIPFFLLISCQFRKDSDELSIVHVDASSIDSINLSVITNHVKMIKLETTSECLLSGLSDLYTTQNFMFICDGQKIVQFSRKGKYIRTIGKRGNGPYEYRVIESFTCDDANKCIYVASMPYINCYSFDGTPLLSIKTNRIVEFMILSGDTLLTFSNDYIENENNDFITKHLLIRYNNKGTIIDSTLLKKILQKQVMATILPKFHYASNCDDVISYYYPVLVKEQILRDTLYKYSSNSIIPSIKLDFGESVKVKSNSKNLSILNIWKTSRFLFSNYYFSGENQNFFCYDFYEKKQYNMQDGIRDDVFNMGVVKIKALKNNMVYFYKQGYEVSDKIEGVTENSNPVVFIAELKQ